ncbi:MAG: NAD-dependent epimerase/dehydratase family protein [Candidatus Omnitrophica bacterium]|jgi:CDP-paratose 2-epimerase|nr:NAD-dependent epimerase/dehydratase family protein [Candidatus Omnitrophota bacterium]
MRYSTILITGGSGFIGSSLALRLKDKYPKVKIIALDNFKRRGSEINVPILKSHGVEFMHGDIRCPEDLALKDKIGLLIECSAEPSVLAGFGDNPKYIINTNLVGTVNCLELARRDKADIIFLSTSRVYPYEAINALKAKESDSRFEWLAGQKARGFSSQGIDIDFPLDGAKTLYGATKLSSELILTEYIKMYGIRGVINRCGVVAGPGQFGKADQGVVTFWMLAHYFKRNLNYIGFGGQGKQVRDILHVDDLFGLIDLEMRNFNKVNGKIYNAGGGKNCSVSLRELTSACARITENKVNIGSILKDRPGDIKIYLTDNSRVEADLGWRAVKNLAQIFEDTFSWIRENQRELKRII